MLGLLAGCTGGTPEVSETPRRDLAGRPVLSAPPSTAPATPASTTAATSVASPASTVQASEAPRPGTTAAPSPKASAPPYRVVASLSDSNGDQGLEGPSYADLRNVRIEDDGSRARVTLTFAAGLPQRPAARESLGIGVDFYRSITQSESDYQLFADGGPDGWFAYLQTPKGFVRYPGSFALTGSRLVFTVPWSSLGGRTSGRFHVFADWTQGGRPGTLGGNATSQDEAPSVGTAAYGR